MSMEQTEAKPERTRFYIITRFNLPFSFSKGKNLDDTWLTDRMKLFKRYCLTSLENQTDKDFEWLILVDSDTPSKHLDTLYHHGAHLYRMGGIAPKIILCKDMLPAVRKVIKPGRNITARIDNDDAFHPRFVEEAKRIASEIKDGIICFMDGIKIDFCKKQVCNVQLDKNMFPVMVEDNGNETVASFKHDEIDEIAPVTRVYASETMPWAWAMTCHSDNVSNRMTHHVAKIPEAEVLPWMKE